MCTKGSVGQVSADTIDRYIDRYVARYSVDTRSILGTTFSTHDPKRSSQVLLCTTDSRTRAVVAFDPDQWKKWFKDNPLLVNLEERPEGGLLIPTSDKFIDTGGDIFFLLKSDNKDALGQLCQKVKTEMGSYCDVKDETRSSPPSKVLMPCFLVRIHEPLFTLNLFICLTVCGRINPVKFCLRLSVVSIVLFNFSFSFLFLLIFTCSVARHRCRAPVM